MRGTKVMWGTATDVSNVITQAWNIKERQEEGGRCCVKKWFKALGNMVISTVS